MDQPDGTNGIGASGTASDGLVAATGSVWEVIQIMLQTQQEQATLFREGLMTAQQTATVAVERATAPREARAGNVSDFRKLQPPTFSGNGSSLQAEGWFVKMEGLLDAAKIAEEDRVEIVKIQLEDVAHTWWLAEEATLKKPVPWKQFEKGFFERFFPKTAKRELEKQFMNLTQGGRSVDTYAAEFNRLSRFAPRLVSDEEDKATRFEQGLDLEIKKLVGAQSLETYSQVLDSARKVETIVGRPSQSQVQSRQAKRPIGQISGEEPEGPQRPAPHPRPLNVICNFCHKQGHTMKNCRKALGTCLLCGAADHQVAQCPNNRQHQGMMVPVSPQPAVPLQFISPAVPFQARPPLPAQNRVYQARGGMPPRGPLQGRGQNMHMNALQSEPPAEAIPGTCVYPC